MKKMFIIMAALSAVACVWQSNAQTPRYEQGWRQQQADKNKADKLPKNTFFANFGYDTWSTKIVMPDNSKIVPEGISATVGYDYVLGGDQSALIGIGILGTMNRTRFDYQGNDCGTNLYGVYPYLSLRSYNGRRSLFTMHVGVGPSVYSESANRIYAYSPVGWGYIIGLEYGYMLSEHTALTLGYDVFGESYDGNSQQSKHVDLRLGVRRMF